MAFTASNLQTMNVGANAIHIYNSTDNLAAANYWDSAVDLVKVGDHILQSDGTNVKQYAVLTNTGSAVTVGTEA